MAEDQQNVNLKMLAHKEKDNYKTFDLNNKNNLGRNNKKRDVQSHVNLPQMSRDLSPLNSN